MGNVWGNVNTQDKWIKQQRGLTQGMGWVILAVALGIGVLSTTLLPNATNAAERAAVWQALSGLLNIPLLLMTLYLAKLADLRAAKAEEEAQDLRVAALQQAKATQEQAQLWHEDQERARRLEVMVVNVPTHMLVVGNDAGQTKRQQLHLANFSSFPVMLESIELMAVPGKPVPVSLAYSPQDPRVPGAMLQPGEYLYMDMASARREADLVGKRGLEYSLLVTTVSPGHGRVELPFAVRFDNWDREAEAKVLLVDLVRV